MNYTKASIMLNDKTFENTIKEHRLVVVVGLPTMELTFGNPLPVIDTMAEKYEKKVVFGLLNIEENEKISSRFDITSSPVVLVFKDQRMVACLEDNITQKVVEDTIESYL